MGHKTLAMTERYSHLMPDNKRNAVNTLADVLTTKGGDNEGNVISLTPHR